MVKKSTFRPVIKWAGSKRRISYEIVRRFPEFNRYYEPFLGGASILYQANPSRAICGDICKPLIAIWKLIRDNPEELMNYYTNRWKKLQKEGHRVYYQIRDRFNETKEPKHLFFLSRTCVNGLIRFNQEGEFNNSFHHTRPGINPNRLKVIMQKWSSRISGVKFYAGDYEETTDDAEEGDFVYLDPPYFNTKGRYYGSIDRERFLNFLKDLNARGVKYALSLDGSSGDTDYTVNLPNWVYQESYILSSGNSSFKKVMDQQLAEVKESLYLNYSSPKRPEKQLQFENF